MIRTVLAQIPSASFGIDGLFSSGYILNRKNPDMDPSLSATRIPAKSKGFLGLLFLIAVSFLFSSCERIQPCGNFTFTGNTFSGPSNGLNMNLRFDFNPATCGKPACDAPKICYIQMVRIYDLEEGTFSYISEEHQARSIAYGWYVDRLTGKKWGYYGRNDDGTFAGNLTPGNNTTAAILFDGPARPSSVTGIWWQAVSASVSIDGGASSCNNNFLGYYYWSWIVNQDGSISDDNIIQLVAREDLHLVMDNAVSAWNTQAPSISHNTFPAFNKLMY